MIIHVRARRVAMAAAAIAGAAAMTLGVAAPAASSARAAPSVLASAAARVPRCTAADLGVWVAADEISTAGGTMYMPLEFTNLSGHACKLDGFPRVAAVGKDWRQIGSPAAPDHALPAGTVQLAPGATAHAVLEYSDVMTCNCPAADRVTAFALRVYPPGQHQADHALWDFATCSARGSSAFLRLRAVAPGIGVRGRSG
jgi:Protein of unknown function (DUF4232)